MGGADWVPVRVVACWMAAASAFDNTRTSTDTVAGLWLFIQLVICCYSSDCLNRTMTTSTGRHVHGHHVM